jgi:hypothetical protein
MTFDGVDDGKAAHAEGEEQPLEHGYDRSKAVHVVAQGSAEAAGFEEIALHVDDDEREPAGGGQLEISGLGWDESHG